MRSWLTGAHLRGRGKLVTRDPLVELEHPRRGVRGRESLEEHRAGSRTEFGSPRVVVEDTCEPRCERRRIAGWNQHRSGTVDHFTQSGDVAHDGRNTQSHRFHESATEAFVARREREDVSGRQQVRYVVSMTEETDPVSVLGLRAACRQYGRGVAHSAGNEENRSLM